MIYGAYYTAGDYVLGSCYWSTLCYQQKYVIKNQRQKKWDSALDLVINNTMKLVNRYVDITEHTNRECPKLSKIL
jgi:hypothetical protein